MYALRNAVEEKQLAEEAHGKILQVVDDAISWLDANDKANPEEYEMKRNEVDNICRPLMNSETGPQSDGPHIDELD